MGYERADVGHARFDRTQSLLEDEGGNGQAPITALTRRHGYTRGHGMGADGMAKNRSGKKVWFVTTNNAIVEVKVLREFIRTRSGGSGGNSDYTILLFNKDLPESIVPMRVVSSTNFKEKYPRPPGTPWPVMLTEQGGQVSAEIPPFKLNTWKVGDSGSPNMIPLVNELVFVNGRSTTAPTAEMQADMDALCAAERLNPNKYKLQWIDLSAYPSY